MENRIALEMAENSFKDAVHLFQELEPKAALRDYLNALKTTLAGQGITIKIKRGIATFSGEIEKVDHAATKAKEALENIFAASEKIFNMAPSIIQSSEDCIFTIEKLNAKSTIKSQCASPKHAIQTVKLFKDNCKMMKSVPKMVKDFTNEAEQIISEMLNAFGEEGEAGPSNTGGRHQQARSKDQSKDTKSKDKKMGKNKDGNNKNGKDKKDEYEKALKMEYIDVPDIDYLFQDFSSAINPFVTSREKLEKARKSFEVAMNMLIDFDAEKELQEYFKELKRKAVMDEIHIYVDFADGCICVSSITGVPVPKPYSDAVKCINDIKACAVQLLNMEPQIDRGVQSCLDDLSQIDPMKDLRRELNLKGLLQIRGKVKKFNSNLKKVQKAPKIIKDFFNYIKKTLSDIKEFFEEES